MFEYVAWNTDDNSSVLQIFRISSTGLDIGTILAYFIPSQIQKKWHYSLLKDLLNNDYCANGSLLRIWWKIVKKKMKVRAIPDQIVFAYFFCFISYIFHRPVQKFPKFFRFSNYFHFQNILPQFGQLIFMRPKLSYFFYYFISWIPDGGN